MKSFATLIAAAAIAATVPFAANADSYINSNPQKQFNATQSHSSNAHAKSNRSRNAVKIRPASRGKKFNFGSFVRDTSREGYGPNGGR